MHIKKYGVHVTKWTSILQFQKEMNIILISLLLHSLFHFATDINSAWRYACTKSKTLVLNAVMHNWYVIHFINISHQII